MDKIKFSKDHNSLWIEKICVIYKDKVLFLKFGEHLNPLTFPPRCPSVQYNVSPLLTIYVLP